MDFKRIKRLAAFCASLVIGSAFLGSGAGCAQGNSYEDFFIAVRNDNASVVRDLLQRGFDPNTRTPAGQVGLTLAFLEDSPKAAQLLLARPDLNLDVLNAAGESALMLAALKGNLPAVSALLDRGARVNQPGWSALHYAATGPQVQAVQMLLDRGARINAAAPNGSTPLMMAAQYGPQASVELLLERGADRAQRTDKMLQAVDFARQAGRDDVVRMLERFGR